MSRLLSWHHRRIFLSVTLFFLLSLLLAACGGGSGSTPTSTPTTGTGSGGATPTPAGGAPTATPTIPPGVRLGVQPCPAAVANASYWTGIVHAQTGISAVARVECANLLGNPSLQALVDVGYDGTGHIMDVHVYNNITSPSPTQVFQTLGLYKGDAHISGYNTVMTAEVDMGSTLNNGQPNAGLQQDLFREFKWSDSVLTLVPVAFPGLFPDLTRYQAESDQKEVNAGHQPWKVNATQVAQALAADQTLLKWAPNSPATVVSGGGAHDLQAVVNVKSGHPGGGTIQVTMTRLEGNTNGGIWEVTSVTTGGLTITTPHALDHLTSPLALSCGGPAFEGVIGNAKVLDHLYTDVGHHQVRGQTGNGPTTCTATSIAYKVSFHGGLQEGIIALFTNSQADGSISGAVLVKVLLSA